MVKIEVVNKNPKPKRRVDSVPLTNFMLQKPY